MMQDIYSRHIKLDGALNIRDLGGYRAGGGRQTKWRSFWRGDSLHLLNPAEVLYLAGERVRTIIDLRSALELEAEPNPFVGHTDVRYHNIPLFAALAPAHVMAESGTVFVMADRYRAAIDRCHDRIAEVMAIMADAEEGIVLFHCTAGKDRTGIISALLLSLAGVEPDDIVEDYALTETLAAPLISRLRTRALGRGHPTEFVDALLASRPESMRVTLDHIANAHGGCDAYLTKAGLSETTLAALRNRISATPESKAIG